MLGESSDRYAVELRNLTKRFDDVVAVDHVNLQIESGELFALLGPSGCGKTTTLRLIGGLEEQDEGDVLIQGQVVNDLPAYKRDSSIVFQDLALFPHMTVEQNVLFGLERRDVPEDKARSRAKRMLELVKLGGMGKRRPDQLSGGQQQRVALARSLVLNPGVLLLDEPLSSLDRKLRQEMQVELKRIQREVKTTFLYVTHDQEVALSLSDRMAVMNQGKFVQVGTPETLYERPRTPFVADFMGATNIFLGDARREGDGEIKLVMDNERVIQCPKRNDAEPDDITGVSIRPGIIQIREPQDQWDIQNRFSGQVVEWIYQGDHYEVTVELDSGETVVAYTQEKGRFQEDQAVMVGWNSMEANLLYKS